MARLPRVGVAGWPHLLVQRVHDGQFLARDDTDRHALLAALRESAHPLGVAVHAYTLGSDHFHLLLTPPTDEALSLLMQALGRRYVPTFNRRHGRQGSLWSGRFRATVLEPARYLLDAMVFVDTHAVRAGEVLRCADDAWSSAPAHLGLRSDPVVTDHALFWALGNTPFEREAAWRQRLDAGLSPVQLAELARAMHAGWALLTPASARVLEGQTGRRLTPKPRGRPRKVQVNAAD